MSERDVAAASLAREDWVLPRIEAAVPYDDELEAGDVIDLADGRLTFVPAPGWQLEEGVRVGRTRSGISNRSSSVIAHGDVRMGVLVAPLDGTPSDLLTRIDDINDRLGGIGGLSVSGERYTVRTDAGAVGVAEHYTGIERQGTLTTFVIPVPGSGTGAPTRTGVEVVVVGSETTVAARHREIDGMVRSIRAEPAS